MFSGSVFARSDVVLNQSDKIEYALTSETNGNSLISKFNVASNIAYLFGETRNKVSSLW